MADTMKRCYACGYQPRSEFNKRKRSKDGLDDLCRACKSDGQRRYYQRNPDRIKQKSSEWYAKNKGIRVVTAAEYYQRTQSLKPVIPCKCGCGGITNPGREFINGHVNKGRVFDAVFRLKMALVKRNISPETRRKMSESSKKRADLPELRAKLAVMAGERTRDKHPNWLGGISKEAYGAGWTKELKKAVLERDKGKCRNPGCLGKSKNINRHHIDYDKKHNVISNLITLCTPCHAVTNANRRKWRAFYESVLMGDMLYLEVASNVR
jgi:hypothetical protein